MNTNHLSMLVGQLTDSGIFILLAFYGMMMPTMPLLGMILIQWVAKSIYEAIATPVMHSFSTT